MILLRRTISITDKLLGFDVLNADKAVINGSVEETSYVAVEEFNANLRGRLRSVLRLI